MSGLEQVVDLHRVGLEMDRALEAVARLDLPVPLLEALLALAGVLGAALVLGLLAAVGQAVLRSLRGAIRSLMSLKRTRP